jgi:acyl-coenzyme A thioesterase PaaI-like protein
MDENELQGRTALADATRHLIRATRVTLVDTEPMAEAAALIERAAGLLEAETFAGPHSQVGLDITASGPDMAAEPRQYFPYSSVIGPLNPISVPVELEVADLADLGIDGPTASLTGNGARGRAVLPEQYVGPPWNIVHGGIIAHIFDELLGVATIAGGAAGFTGRLTVHFRKPTPALQPLELVAWIESVSGRKTVARGEIRHDGIVTAEADGLFIGMAGQEPGRRVPLADIPG